MSIQRHEEVAGVQPDYSNLEFSDEEIDAGAHRTFVGGSFERHGRRQLEFLSSRGLQPQHTMLDIGCGIFRGGRHFIDYLDPGHYFGVEANATLIQTGYDRELTDAQRSRAPVENFLITDRFWTRFPGTTFDYALAQSVFTHVSLNHVRLCLFRTAAVMKPGGSFYATFFVRPDSTRLGQVFNKDGRRPFFSEKNVFWYYRADIEWAASFGPWSVNYIGDWGHPAGQKMVEFVRLEAPETRAWRDLRARGPYAPYVASLGPTSRRAALRRHETTITEDLVGFARRGRGWARRRFLRR